MTKKALLKDMNRISTVLFQSGDMSQYALDVWEGLMVDIENRLVQYGNLSSVSKPCKLNKKNHFKNNLKK